MSVRAAIRAGVALGAALALSCGGSDESDSSSGGGGTSTGGGSGATTSTGGNTAANCPAAASGACEVEGQVCEYAGSPCGQVATCTGGTWTTETVCPPQPDCPTALPEDGSPCPAPPTPVSGPLQCRFEPCPEGTLSGYQYEASCSFDAPTWQIQDLDCIAAVECGECPPGICCDGFDACPAGSRVGQNQCPEGHLCMRMEAPSGWYWDCAVDNCTPEEVDCSCVGNVCNQRLGSGWQCTQAEGPRITCECVDC